jgi:predicted ATPase
VVQSIRESDQREAFAEIFDQAFPGASLGVRTEGGFRVVTQLHRMPREFDAHELSDGTLQFLCLAAILCSPKPAPLLVLNEPESSLNECTFSALARAVALAAERSQILVVSHSQPLCDAIAASCKVQVQSLTMRQGETRLVGQDLSRRCFVFEDEEEE